ncbi:MAG: RNA-binding protein [Bacteroidetes bacterium]|nr:RNA-binding protein [Bacteroidota bacterium]
MNIFVAKLSPAITSEDLQELFSEYGEVVSAKVIIDKETQQSKRFGFVEMKSQEDGLKAIEDLDGCEYDKSTIVVKKAEPKADTGNKFNRGGNNRNRFNGPRRN